MTATVAECYKNISSPNLVVGIIGNVEDGNIYEYTIIYYREDLKIFADEIGEYLGVGNDYIQEQTDEMQADISIIVGTDFREE